MQKTLRAGRVSACGRPFMIGVVLIAACIWMGAGEIARATAQASAPSTAAASQPQTPAAAQKEMPVPPGATLGEPTSAPSAGPQTKESPPYLVGRWWAFVIAIAFLVAVLLLTVLVKSKGGFNFFQSPDGAVSVSKVQVWMWTMTLIFSYVYL